MKHVSCLTIRFLSILLPLSATLSHASTAPRFLLHAVGDTITTEEAQQYNLFEDVFGFEYAAFTASGFPAKPLLVVRSFDGVDTFKRTIPLEGDLLDIIPHLLNRADSLAQGIPVSNGVPVELVPQYGSEKNGFATVWTGQKLIVEHHYGTDIIPLDDILDLNWTRSSPAHKDVYGFPDPNRTRLFFMPTGRSLKAGEGYFADYEVVFPSVQVGVGYNISIGGGFFPLSVEEFTLAWVTGQVGIVDRETFSLAVGNLSIFTSDSNAGIFYGVSSYGTSKLSGSVGLGFGFVEGEISENPMVVLGGEFRTGRSTKLISENWIIPGVDVPVVSLGFRWFGERLAADFALARPITDDDLGLIGIPWVDFVVHF